MDYGADPSDGCSGSRLLSPCGLNVDRAVEANKDRGRAIHQLERRAGATLGNGFRPARPWFRPSFQLSGSFRLSLVLVRLPRTAPVSRL